MRFQGLAAVGEILDLAARYRSEGADELVFYDIGASPEGRTVERRWVAEVASLLDIPFCVAGGIRSVQDAEAVLGAGAEKVSINSPALEDPTLITRLAERFGSQCVVVGIDSRTEAGDEGPRYTVGMYSGSAERARPSGRTTLEWVREVQDRGAGEIVLNCVASDGVRQGYDLAQLARVRAACEVPLIASGGAGRPEHFRDVFHATGVDGALAASVFHSGEIGIPGLKRYLRTAGVEVRP